MIRTRHTEIRAEMVRMGINGKELAEKLGCAQTTLSAKLCGKTPWNTDEMYYLMDLFKLPLNQLHIYFPRNGISDPRNYRKLRTDVPSLPEIKAI